MRLHCNVIDSAVVVIALEKKQVVPNEDFLK